MNNILKVAFGCCAIAGFAFHGMGATESAQFGKEVSQTDANKDIGTHVTKLRKEINDLSWKSREAQKNRDNWIYVSSTSEYIPNIKGTQVFQSFLRRFQKLEGRLEELAKSVNIDDGNFKMSFYKLSRLLEKCSKTGEDKLKKEEISSVWSELNNCIDNILYSHPLMKYYPSTPRP